MNYPFLDAGDKDIITREKETCCSRMRGANSSRLGFDSISTQPTGVSFSLDFNIGHVCRFTSFRVYCRDDIHPRCSISRETRDPWNNTFPQEGYFQTIDGKISLQVFQSRLLRSIILMYFQCYVSMNINFHAIIVVISYFN